jgi:hypothetical protein
MSVADFLFEGKPPASVTTYGVAAKDTPAWYSDYTQGLVAKANAIAAAPYQTFGGPRVAGFDPQQLQAFNLTPELAASYKPQFTAAANTLSGVDDTTGMAAAQPYFSQAGQTLPQGINAYMNPYTDQVVNRIGDLAKRQLSENIIPTIQSQFIGGGSFGGSRSGEALARGMRDLQESTMAQQAQALQQGYTQAGSQMQADQTRLAQMGQAAGNLQGADLARLLELAKQQETLGGLQQQAGLTEAAAMESVGGQKQALAQKSMDTAYQDFQAQQNDPYNRIAFMNAAVRGLELPSRGTTETTGPAAAYQPSVLSQLASTGMTIAGLKKTGII